MSFISRKFSNPGANTGSIDAYEINDILDYFSKLTWFDAITAVVGTSVYAVWRDGSPIANGTAGSQDAATVDAMMGASGIGVDQIGLAVGNMTLEQHINVPDQKTLMKAGRWTKKASGFSGTRLVKVYGNFAKFVNLAGLISGIDRTAGINGIECTSGGSVLQQRVYDAVVYNCDKNFVCTRDAGAGQTNYGGRLVNCISVDGNTSFEVSNKETHDWLMEGCISWNHYNYGVRVLSGADGQPSLIRAENTLIQGRSSNVACIEDEGIKSRFSDNWTEAQGGLDYLIQPKAVRSRIRIGLMASLDGIRDLGQLTTWEGEDEFQFIKIADDFTQGMGKWTTFGTATGGTVAEQTIFDQTGVCRIQTGTTINNVTGFKSNTDCFVIGGLLPPSFAVTVKLAQLTDVRARLGFRLDNSNWVIWTYDSGVDANWHCECKAAGVATNSNPSVTVPAITANQAFRIFCTTGKVYFMNGSDKTDILTNIPVGTQLHVYYSLENLTAANKIMDVRTTRAMKIAK